MYSVCVKKLIKKFCLLFMKQLLIMPDFFLFENKPFLTRSRKNDYSPVDSLYTIKYISSDDWGLSTTELFFLNLEYFFGSE